MATIFNTEQEVKDLYNKDRENNQIVIFKGTIYNVKAYMPQHPGGPEYIEKLLGQSIDEDFEEAEHTKSARKIFNDLPVVGYMKGNEPDGQKLSQGSKGELKKDASGQSVQQFEGVYGKEVKINLDMNERINFDYNKGLIYQIYAHKWSFEDYYQYINEPKHLINPVRLIRMFDNSFLEMMSQTPWYYIPIFFSPLGYFLASNMTGSALFNLFFIIAGVINWGLAEYLLHRFVFHGEDTWMKGMPQLGSLYAFHFMIHGIHHAFPQDAMRLVFPPLLGHLIFYFIFWLPMLIIPDVVKFPLMVGILIGYQSYDLMHYAFHHSNPAEGFFKEMKTYHMQHHYKQGQIGFGVSQKFWDKVFGTEIIMK